MPLVMSSKELERIKKWTNPPSEDPEVAMRREYIEYLNKASKEMTKNWTNSLENMNKRNEELRQARIKMAEEANTKFYKKYLKKKKEEEDMLMYSARETVFKNRDIPRLLIGAVIETAVQKERSLQLEFLQKLRQEEAEVKRQEDEEIIRKAKEWHEDVALKKQRRYQVNKEHQQILLEQVKEQAERNCNDAEINQQKLDNIEADKEKAAIKRFETHMKQAERERIFYDMKEAMEATEERKREALARAKLDSQMIEVLNRSRARIEAKRRQTEQDARDQKARRLETITANLKAGGSIIAQKEEAALAKAVQESQAAQDAADLKRKRNQERIFKERQEIQQQFLRDEAQRLHELKTTRQWELMNRLKLDELNKEFEENIRKQKVKRKGEYKNEIVKLWTEREERDAKERADQLEFYGVQAERKLRDEDNRVLTYAAHLLEECRQNGRPEFPLHRVIDIYCKKNQLYPATPLPKSLAAHFKGYKPVDLSVPDPDYIEPRPPPTDSPKAENKAPPAPAPTAPAPPAKHDGVRSPPKAGPSKPEAGNDKQEPDYKRMGKANGLQQRNLPVVASGSQQPDLQSTLKVSEAPVVFKTPVCLCDLKPTG